MAKPKEREVAVLPSEWTLSMVSAWRVFERSLNPSFSFLIKCNKCGEVGHPMVTFVMSKKNEKAILGMECTSCLNTLKFEGTIDGSAEDFPQFLKGQGKSVLTIDGDEPGDYEQPDEYLEMMFDDE